MGILWDNAFSQLAISSKGSLSQLADNPTPSPGLFPQKMGGEKPWGRGWQITVLKLETADHYRKLTIVTLEITTSLKDCRCLLEMAKDTQTKA